jgi:membrane protein DedA with SNARE-associated domain
MESLIDTLLAWVGSLANHPVALFAALCALGFANVFVPPVPIEALTMAGGVFAGAGQGSPLLIWLATSLGMSVGSTVLYLLASSRGHKLLEHAFIARQFPPGGLEKLHAWFERFGVWAIFLGKAVPGFSFATVLFAGLAKLGKRKALPAIFVANFLFFGLLVSAGRLLGRDWQRLVRLEFHAEWLAVLLPLLGLLAWWWFLARRKQRARDAAGLGPDKPSEED